MKFLVIFSFFLVKVWRNNAEVDESIVFHYRFKKNITDFEIVDNFDDKISTKVYFNADLTSPFIDYAAACAKLSPDYSTPALISGCYSSLEFSVRNRQLFAFHELAYNTIKAVTAAEVTSLDLHMDAGVLLAGSYPIFALPFVGSSEEPRNICVFGKFSLKLTLLAMSRKGYNLKLFVHSSLSEIEAKTINIVAGIAKLNNQSIVVTQGAPSTWQQIFTSPAMDIKRPENAAQNYQNECDICDFIVIWGDETVFNAAVPFSRSPMDLKEAMVDTHGNPLGPPLLMVHEFETKNDTYMNVECCRFRNLSEQVLWEASMSWPTWSAVLERRNGLGHVQQQFDLSFVSNSTQTNIWYGRIREPPGSSSSNKSKLKKRHRNRRLKDANHQSTGPSSRCHRGRFEYLVLITYTNEVFFENALGLRRAIVSLNIADVVTTGDYSFDRLQALFGNRSMGDCKVLQIAMGPHEPTYLLPHYVVYDAEQVWSIFMDIPSYLSVLRDADGIFIMSERHRNKFRSIAGVNLTNIFPLPFYSAPAVSFHMRAGDGQGAALDAALDDALDDALYIDDRIPAAASANQSQPTMGFDITIGESQPLDPTFVDDYDVLFFGSCSDYRREFLSLFEEFYVVRNARGKQAPYSLNIKCLKVWSDALVGARRDVSVQRAKLIVNIHAVAQSSLEVHRLNYLLAMGKCVVSEGSVHDPSLDKQYSEAVVIGNSFTDIVSLVFELLANDTKRLQCEDRAKAMYRHFMSNTTELNRALQLLLTF